MANLIKVGLSIIGIVIILYCVYMAYDVYSDIVNRKNTYIQNQNNYYIPDNGIKYMDVNIKPNGYNENIEIVENNDDTESTQQINNSVSPTIKITVKPVITPTIKPSVNIPKERVTFYKNSDDAKKVNVCSNSIDTHDGLFVVSNKNWNWGSSYYYVGDYMVMSGEFINLWDRNIINPTVKITCYYNVYGKWIAAKSFNIPFELNIKPGEHIVKYIDYTIPGDIPPGYYRISADFNYEGKTLLTINKEIDILN
jgi:hypothetical protein